MINTILGIFTFKLFFFFVVVAIRDPVENSEKYKKTKTLMSLKLKKDKYKDKFEMIFWIISIILK